MTKELTKHNSSLLISLLGLSIFLFIFVFCSIFWLLLPRISELNIDYVIEIMIVVFASFSLFFTLIYLNLIFNLNNIKVLNFLDKYTFLLINFLFPLIVFLGKIFGVNKRKIERSFIDLNNFLYTNNKIKVKASDILVISPHCLQLASCPHKITHHIKNCKRCNQCTVGPLITLSEEIGFNFRVVTGGTLARKTVKELRPKLVLAIACERDLASGIQDVYPLPSVGVLNIRPNGPCYNTTVDIEEVKTMLKKCISD